MNDIEIIASKHLGKAGDGTVVSPYKTPEKYDPSLLVPIPRELNRKAYNITGSEFIGFDVWNAYEVSFLTYNGYPVNCIAKICYPSCSEFIVESKSLKLYLNSFNMDKMGDTPSECIEKVQNIVEHDLSYALQSDVKVCLHDVSATMKTTDNVTEKHFHLLEGMVDLQQIIFDEYSENPNILKSDVNHKDNMTVWTPSLRSNCRVTNQPDWGDVYIHMKGLYYPTPESLLKFIVSMRSENHFHEEICECIYKRLLDLFNPEKLFVMCLYTRRGGIDINPIRCNNDHLLKSIVFDFMNVNKISVKTLRQ